MSNAKQAAFENLQRLSMLLKDIIAIGPELAQIASLEGATAEAQAKLDATRAAILKERADHDRAISNGLATHRADIAKVKNDSEADAAARRDEAQKVLDEAQVNADSLLAKAKADAAAQCELIKTGAADYERRLNAARTAFNEIERQRAAAAEEIETGRRDRAAVAEYAQQVAVAKSELATTQQRQSEATAELARLTAAIADRQAEHDRVEGMLEELATKIRRRK